MCSSAKKSSVILTVNSRVSLQDELLSPGGCLGVAWVLLRGCFGVATGLLRGCFGSRRKNHVTTPSGQQLKSCYHAELYQNKAGAFDLHSSTECKSSIIFRCIRTYAGEARRLCLRNVAHKLLIASVFTVKKVVLM